MTPRAIIRQTTADGVNLALSPAGTIKATGVQAAVSSWLPVIRENKSSIVAALREARRLAIVGVVLVILYLVWIFTL